MTYLGGNGRLGNTLLQQGVPQSTIFCLAVSQHHVTGESRLSMQTRANPTLQMKIFSKTLLIAYFWGENPLMTHFSSGRVTAPRNRGIPTVYANLRQPTGANEIFLEKTSDYIFLGKKSFDDTFFVSPCH